jgi:hypothetical protein
VREAGVEVPTLPLRLRDFNEDLPRLGLAALAHCFKDQLVSQDAVRFLTPTR